MKDNLLYLTSIKFPFWAREFKKPSGICSACGAQATFKYFDVINNRLAEEWKINDKLKKAFSVRESLHCSSCRCSTRLRALAKAVSITFADGTLSLRENIELKKLDKLRIAEVNACGDMHFILEKLKNLHYSEYGSRKKTVQNEDLQNLSYQDDYFDLVLTSDSLEHVPDYKKALSEIRRVLKPKGYHIFTIPLIFSRSTRRRIELVGDSFKQLLPSSYHGAGEEDNLVCSEFGIDFLKDLNEANFKTRIYFANPLNKNEVNCVLVTEKVEDGKKTI